MSSVCQPTICCNTFITIKSKSDDQKYKITWLKCSYTKVKLVNVFCFAGDRNVRQFHVQLNHFILSQLNLITNIPPKYRVNHKLINNNRYRLLR